MKEGRKVNKDFGGALKRKWKSSPSTAAMIAILRTSCSKTEKQFLSIPHCPLQKYFRKLESKTRSLKPCSFSTAILTILLNWRHIGKQRFLCMRTIALLFRLTKNCEMASS